MKKIIALAIIVIMAFSFAGCATGSKSSGGSSVRKLYTPKSAPAKVSFGGQSKVRSNVWSR